MNYCLLRESTALLATRKRIDVLDSYISYLDTGYVRGGHVVIFLHGNPTQAYVWRHVIEKVSPIYRCIAWDQIGFGQSGRINSNYTFPTNYAYLDAWLNALDLPHKIHFAVIDWGATVGFHWANLHRDRVASMILMEPVIFVMPSWQDFPPNFRWFFWKLQDEDGGNGSSLSERLVWAVLAYRKSRHWTTYISSVA